MGGIFLAALIVYFVISYNSMEKSNTVYAAMDEPSMPVVFVNSNGLLMNPMHAYVQDMGNKAARDCITVLPEDRKLQLVVNEYDNMVANAQYEIRSLDLGHLIENGSVDQISRANGQADIILPIQNLIKKDQEYLLKITLNTGEKSLNYYTRILWTDKNYSLQMLQLAMDFTQKTFDKNAARNLAVYLESDDTGDNSTLGHVNLHSSFSQITWGNTGMQPSGTYYVTLKECSGVMGEVQIDYESFMSGSDAEKAVFHNEDNYVLRYDPKRIYMMDFDRVTNEIFDGSSARFAGKKALLGIASDDSISTMQSPSKEFIAFKTDQMLLRYDQDHGGCVSLFSYRSALDDGIRANYSAHDMKILSVKDNGDVDFLVYGYINRGLHEGYNGIVYYTYDNSENTVTENFFIALPDVYEKIKYNLDKLSYLSDSNMLYFYYGGTVYGIDTNSLEVVTVASGLEDAEFAASQDGRYIACQSGDAADIYHSEGINMIDLSDDTSSSIALDGRYVRIFGFIGQDLIFGSALKEQSATYTISHEIPVSEIRIVGPEQDVKTSYTKEGLLFSNISIKSGRIHFDELTLSGKQYAAAGEDTIVCNKKTDAENAASLGNFADKEKQKCWYIEIKDVGTKKTSTNAPKHFSVEKASNIDLSLGKENKKSDWFNAYSYGHFRGKTRTLRESYDLVGGQNGYVTDENQQILWNRIDKETVKIIDAPMDHAEALIQKLPELTTMNRYDSFIMLNAEGIDLNSMLYYVGKGIPIVAYSATGYDLIYGYDQFNIHLLDPATQKPRLMGKADAEAFYKAAGYRFAAAVPAAG